MKQIFLDTLTASFKMFSASRHTKEMPPEICSLLTPMPYRNEDIQNNKCLTNAQIDFISKRGKL